MKRSTRITGLLAMLVALPGMAEDAEGPRIFPYETHRETLDNGLRVLLVPMNAQGLVAYWTIVRTGSRDEYEKGHSGFAHFFEHMMFRGTENYPAEVYNEMLTAIGADTNAYTTDDLTAYHLGIAAEDLETVVRLESDRFRNLSYAEPEFRTEAGAVYGEYRKNRMRPFFQLYEKLLERAFTVHTYGHTTMGYERDIKAMPEMYEYSKTFFSNYYRPDNVVLLVAGDIDVERTMALVREHYGAWEPGYVPPKIVPEPEQREQRRVDVRYEGRTLPLAWVVYKADAFDPDDRVAMAGRLLAELAFGSTSEIYRKLVLDEQVVESLGADMGIQRDPGVFDIFARIKDPERVDYVLAELDAVIEGLRQSPPEAERLEALKSRLKYEFLMGLDTPDRVASRLARIIAVSGGLEAVDRMHRTFEQVTPADVQAAARRYLVDRRRTVGVLRGDG